MRTIVIAAVLLSAVSSRAGTATMCSIQGQVRSVVTGMCFTPEPSPDNEIGEAVSSGSSGTPVAIAPEREDTVLVESGASILRSDRMTPSKCKNFKEQVEKVGIHAECVP